MDGVVDARYFRESEPSSSVESGDDGGYFKFPLAQSVPQLLRNDEWRDYFPLIKLVAAFG